ncbi:hypothetical protein CI088_09660 [Enterococcus plantarum]|uniref:Uncharacterized protein n=1 Tax=Enterococcus plantarum TaxID=1077675 RepID=A0A2W3YZF5_9ENTE|nr:hypothetical protein [Enterococcus plantarum]PZL73011.1 hypothetical protein CI088_09660 [Enterococcus plantarum]
MNVISDLNNQSHIFESLEEQLKIKKKKQVFILVGDKGTGKSVFCQDLNMKLENLGFNSFLLKIDNPSDCSEYEPFYNGIRLLNDKHIEDNVTFLGGAAKGIPFVGEAISALIDLVYKKSRTRNIELTEKEATLIDSYTHYFNDKPVFFVCDDFEKWSNESQKLLLNFIGNPFNIEKLENLNFLLTCSPDSLNSEFIKKIGTNNIFQLSKIDVVKYPYIIKEFNRDLDLSLEKIKLLNHASDGNLAIVEDLVVNNISIDTGIIKSRLYEELVSKIQKECDDSNDFIRFLKVASIIDDPILKDMLKEVFSDKQENYYQNLGYGDKYELFKNIDPYIKFNSNTVKGIIRENITNKEKYYYKKFEEALRLIFPTNYLKRALCYYEMDETQKAITYFILHSIQSFRRTQIKKTKDELSKEISISFSDIKFDDFLKDYSFYEIYCESFSNYLKDDYLNSIKKLNYKTSNDLYKLELNFLKALNTTNYSINKGEYEFQLEELERCNSFTTSLQQSEPDIWIRNSILLLDYYLETGKLTKQKKLKKQIDEFIMNSKSTDLTVRNYDNLLKTKANVYYRVQTSYGLTLESVNYFKDSNKKIENIVGYYISLINNSANALILGDEKECFSSLYQIAHLFENFQNTNFPQKNAFLNNLILSNIRFSKKTSEEIIYNISKLLEQNNFEMADTILINSNIAALMFLNGNKNDGLDLIKNTYDNLLLDDSDDYYYYYVANNYAIMHYIADELTEDDTLKILNSIMFLKPNVFEQQIYKKRIELLITSIKNGSLKNSADFNTYIIQQEKYFLNPSWTFFGTSLILSELQIWSDVY